MLIRNIFLSDVTRDIPPVVYFHEQTPAKVANEVSEYIVTGGWPEEHPNHRRVPEGIHEQYVRLLKGIAAELAKPGGPELPTAWISGFYGSGKSSFAKLLGLALDGMKLPDGTLLADAWLRRNESPRRQELADAWSALTSRIKPIAVVFDIGGVARDNEHIHSAAVRQVQRRLDYCSTEPLVADFELKLERDGEWPRFLAAAAKTLDRPWDEVKHRQFAEEEFSRVLSVLYPERYTDPMSWFTSRGGTHARGMSVEESVTAIRDMLAHRRPEATLFLVVDEVSQYVLSNEERVGKLSTFASALGATLKGKAWLLALGQQKLDEQAAQSFLVGARDRFLPRLRFHLAPTNIRDVVHRRLLRKKPQAEAQLRALFAANRPDLKRYAYGCEAVTEDELVEDYPLLPGHIELLLQLTSALRVRSARAQGDDQAIRGLLQLLGELFRERKLADLEVGALVTLDQVYDVQHTALDADAQTSMARLLGQCARDSDDLPVRAAKAVALLELIQDTTPTDATLVAKCLYDRVDRGNRVAAVTEALEELRRKNLLSYSEKTGYKLQSSAGEEWERERREIGVAGETILELVQAALKRLLADPDRPRYQTRSFPWAGVFSGGRTAKDVELLDPRDDAAIKVDLRLLSREERIDSTWVKHSAEADLWNRLVWIGGEREELDTTARELARSKDMVLKYKSRRESLAPARKLLLQQEENRAEDLEGSLRDAVASCWFGGKLYFRGRALIPQEHGATFAAALHAMGTQLLPQLFPQFTAAQVQPAEVLQLIEKELSGPSRTFLPEELGILELDRGRYMPSCTGVVPRRVQQYIEQQTIVGGTDLLAHFGGPPCGYTVNVVKACVAGLLRAGRIRIQPEGGREITAVRDAGVRDVFEKDRSFRRANFLPAGEDDVGYSSRAAICKFFEETLKTPPMARENDAIADAAAQQFPALASRLRDVLERLGHLPLPEAARRPVALSKLGDALEEIVRSCRETLRTVQNVKARLDVLREGITTLQLLDAEVTEPVVQAVRAAVAVREHQGQQLRQIEELPAEAREALDRLDAHLAPEANERPWRDLVTLKPDLDRVRAIYAMMRRQLLESQQQQSEQVRLRVVNREGFATLDVEIQHRVLRPIQQAVTNTTDAAVAPPLASLREPFAQVLRKAEETANELLDEILSEGEKPLIVRVDLALRNREVASEADIEALLAQVRGRLLEHVRAGARVRIV